ncbi:MAG: CBS domain-containing protein [Anaerolineaceae bacterium]|nr:CBS domain-containing protein [Anaerolineaceae bacterium]
MFVGSRMKTPVITISPKTSLDEALSIMTKEHIRRLPVVNEAGTLIGIVTELELMKASPSGATTLSVWEIKSLLSAYPVEKIMTTSVVTVTEDTPIEEAARIMADNEIGGIPVVRKSEVVGFITETDIFKAFLEVFGARDSGIRLTIELTKKPGTLSTVTKAISELGGNILLLGSFLSEDTDTAQLVLKVDGVKEDELVKAIEPYCAKIADVRMI